MSAQSANTWQLRTFPLPNFQWCACHAGRVHQCPYCHIPLFSGENPGFCCGPGGSRLQQMPSLPPLPYEFQRFIHDPRLSSLSRILCLIFSFASLECTAEFPSFTGPPGFFAIHGCIYHQVRPTHQNSAVRWLLYDGFLPKRAPYQNWASLLPAPWVQAVTHALFRVNPFVRSLRQLSFAQPSAFPEANVIIEDQGTSPEVCVFHALSFSLIGSLS